MLKTILASVPVWLAVAVGAAEPALGPLSADAQRILSFVDRLAPQRTEADKRAAGRLNRDGERAYRQGDYRTALRAYSNSYPNYPTALAYIMAGDSHWRGALQLAKARAASPEACVLPNEHFSHDLLMDVQQHHEVGLALAARSRSDGASADPLVRRARESAVCLRSLALRYETQARTACVDVAALDACLGAPLLP